MVLIHKLKQMEALDIEQFRDPRREEAERDERKVSEVRSATLLAPCPVFDCDCV
jgi:hypothetical protein